MGFLVGKKAADDRTLRASNGITGADNNNDASPTITKG
jgi:hypothetical protein